MCPIFRRCTPDREKCQRLREGGGVSCNSERRGETAGKGEVGLVEKGRGGEEED